MIQLSKKEDYAIILINKLVQNYNKQVVSIKKIAKEYKISPLFLRNIANMLRKEKIINAIEGKKGGYFLEKDPKKLSVGEVLSVFSKRPILDCCSFLNEKNKNKCPKMSFCQPGFAWRKLNIEFLDKIYNLSIEDFFKYKTH